jgi:GNAT superfamily N-acetyltransferase
MNPLAPVQVTDDSQSDNPFVAQSPTLADGWQANSRAYADWVAQQRADGVARGLIDPQTGWPTQNALIDAAHQFGGAMIGGTEAPGGGLGRALGSLEDVKNIWTGRGIDHHVSENNGVITLSKIVVPKDARGNGVGTQAMRTLNDYADATGQKVALTPDTTFGASSLSRLTNFYKGLGFTSNKGRSRDFSTQETMIRNPIQAPSDE